MIRFLPPETIIRITARSLAAIFNCMFALCLRAIFLCDARWPTVAGGMALEIIELTLLLHIFQRRMKVEQTGRDEMYLALIVGFAASNKYILCRGGGEPVEVTESLARLELIHS